MATRYKVFFTPLVDMNMYGDEIEVTERVRFDGLGNIKKGIDSQDYEIGVYSYDDLEIKGINSNGYFNDEQDNRSIFKVSRDLCRVRVVFSNDVDGETITYRGLINEEATRINATGDEITFRVLSRDSVIRNTKVSAGTISAGMTFKSSMLAILNDPKITSVLTILDANINPDLNLTVDVATAFDNKSVRENMNKLLLASNSVMLINDAGEVFVQSRTEKTDKDILNLYGPYDLKRRQNVIKITDYNQGKHRMFNSVRIATTEVSIGQLVVTYGFRQKKVELDFMTDITKRTQIATRLVQEFSAPKIELKIEVPTSVARGYDLLDRVSIEWPLRVKPVPGKFLPIVGAAIIGDPDTPLPYTFGSIQIPSNLGFKIIEITEDPKDFTSILKLRQVGRGVSDGWFNAPANSILGFAVIGDGTIGGTGSPCDTFNPSVVGAAKISCTEVA